MKSFTNIEQSKKLAKILPLESADTLYCVDFDGDVLFIAPKQYSGSFRHQPELIIPCWSLAALLGVLPSVIKRNGKRMFLTLEKAGAYNLYYKSHDRLDELWETKEELIDACVVMIEKLHEQKLL